ncbi:MAG TPA: hypothetical protein VHD90_27395 [Phototrophicaceae bacterium]|nr:hypothetical protein [Phototrophicaceae bacterium]
MRPKPRANVRRDLLVELTIIGAIVLLVLGGCQQAGDPGDVTLKYLQARVANDVTTIRDLSCAAWEGQAEAEAASFRSMQATLDNVSCKQSGTDGDATLVTCTGNIVTSYDGENTPRPIPVYRMTQEDGQWKVCGEGK